MPDLPSAGDTDSKVPEKLIDELHQANDQFRDERHRLNRVHDTYEADLEDREAALAKVREADRHVEDVKKKIDDALPPT